MNTDHFKKKLQEELAVLERELNELGYQNTEGEWEATGDTLDTTTPMADANEAADQLEEYGERRAESDAFQARWNEVKHALEKIDRGTFGKCEVSGEPIEEDRLEANPAARTCKTHM